MATITKDMGIIDIVEKWPDTARVLMEFGMGCLGCVAARFETIEQGAMGHGMDVDALMKALNEVVEQ